MIESEFIDGEITINVFGEEYITEFSFCFFLNKQEAMFYDLYKVFTSLEGNIKYDKLPPLIALVSDVEKYGEEKYLTLLLMSRYNENFDIDEYESNYA